MKTIKYALNNEWYNFIFLALPFIAIPFIWSYMPAEIATHWNLQGQANGYMSKAVGLFLLPLFNVAIYFFLLYLPFFDPKEWIKTDQKPLPAIRTCIVIFMVFINGWSIAKNLGWEGHSLNWIFIFLALFFVFLGNYMRNIPHNYFIGIRVPWTLEDSENWRQTHKFASYLWVAGGLILLILLPILNADIYETFFISIALAISLIPAAYSFYLYKFEN